MNKEEVIEKVRKLLRLSESPNENEAALAATKAKELLTRYSLTGIDIDKESGQADFVQEFSVDIEELNEWNNQLSKVIAHLYNCDVFVAMSKPGLRSNVKLVYMGEETSAKIATYVTAHLIATINRLSIEAFEEKDVVMLWSSLPQDGKWVDVSDIADLFGSQFGKHDREHWLRSYRIGMAVRITEKIMREAKENEREKALALYIEDAVAKYVVGKYGGVKEYNFAHENKSAINQQAADRGYRDGGRVEPRPAIEKGA